MTDKSDEPLYRPEALAYLGMRSFGQVSVRQPMSLKLLTGGFVLAMLAAVLFVTGSEYARKETVAGYLHPVPDLVRVTAPGPAVVERILTAPGREVAAGEPLLELGNSRPLSSGLDAAELMLQELEAQQSRLRQELDSLQRQSALERQRQLGRQALLQTSLQQSEEERRLAAHRLQLAEQELEAAMPLAQQDYITESDLRRLQEGVLAAATALNGTEQRHQSLRMELEDVRYLLDNSPLAGEDRAGRLRNELSELARQRADLSSLSGRLLRAPLAGTVTALNTGVGETVGPGRALLTIIPVDAVLTARLLVPSRAAGFVEAGQAVRLMYDSFPYQKFGTYPGTVTGVSEAALAPGSLDGPVSPAEPVFIARVALAEQTVAAFGGRRPLQPDMLLSADIVLAQRSLLDWMLEPFYSLRGRGAAEKNSSAEESSDD